MSYQVFARKYRPQVFDDLVGQQHVTRTLKNAVEQNRLAHAYLFVGPRGIGKTSTARILAKALNCEKGPTVSPCGACDACREIAQGNSLDVLEIDGASNNGVEQVRELRDNVRYAPSKGRFKIYIIDEVHMLTSAAFNALLKTLEEPPPHVKFIFATTEPQKVLPTILSRCQRFDLHRIPTNLIADHLQYIAGQEKITLQSAAAYAIARGADGGLRDAESMLDQLVAFCGEEIAEDDVLNVFGFTSEQVTSDFVSRILRRETAAALDLLHQQAEAGKDMMRLMCNLIAYLRDLLVFKVKPEAVADEANAEQQGRLGEQAGLIETERLLELIDQFAVAEGRMKWAPNKKLHFEVAVIKAIQTLDQVTLSDVIENLSALRDGKETPPAEPSKTSSSPAKAIPAAAKAAAAVGASRKAVPPPSSPQAEKVAEAESVATPAIDPQKVWADAVEQVRSQRPLIRTWMQSAHVQPAQGHFFRLGFAPGQRSIMDSLSTAKNKTFLEGLLKQITGTNWTLKLHVDESLSEKHPENGTGTGGNVVPMPPQNERKTNPQDAFKDDPLIRDALEIFKGEIRQ